MPAKPANLRRSAASPSWEQDGYLIGDAADRHSLDTSRYYSPALVESILSSASSGDPVAHRQMHHMMARSWSTLANCEQQLRAAALECDWQTSPWTSPEGDVPPEAKQRQAVVDAALFQMRTRQGYLEAPFYDFLGNLVVGTVHTPTAYEILWGMADRGHGMQAVVNGIKTIPPQYTGWRDRPGLEDAFLFRRGGRSSSALEDWPEHQFIVQMPGTLDHPSLSSVLDTLSLWWVAAVYGPKWLIKYVERYGVPFMWANFASGNKADRDAAMAALRTLGSAGYGAFPTGTNFNISQPAQNGELPQEKLITLANELCSQAILGTNLTTKTDGSGSLALGKVHKDGQNRLERSRLKTAAGIVREQLVRAICWHTFGNDDYLPDFRHGDEDETDLVQTADLLTKAKSMGLKVPVSYAHEVLSIPQPVDGEEVLSGSLKDEGERLKGEPGPDGPEDGPEDDPAAAAARAAAADVPATPEDFVDDLTGLFAAVMESAAATGSRLVEADRKTLTETENA